MNKRLFFFDSCLTIIYNTDFVSFRYILFSYFTDFVVSFRWNSFSYFTDFVSFRWISFSYFTDFVGFRFLLYRFRFISLDFVFLLYRFRWILFSFRFVSFRFSVYRYPLLVAILYRDHVGFCVIVTFSSIHKLKWPVLLSYLWE